MIRSLFVVFVGLLHLDCFESQWLTKEAAEWAIAEFDKLEALRNRTIIKGPNRQSSAPFISGDGFRSFCQHICDETNTCRMTPELVKDGECIFVKSDFFDFFAKSVTNRITGKYIIVSHNGDLSSPDGQDDAPRIGMAKHVTSDILLKEYESGRLLALHAQNLWWKNYSRSARPAYAHCIPIGFENRQYKVGGNVQNYANQLRETYINKPIRNETEKANLPLLLVAFYPKSRSPDRLKVLQAIGAVPPKGQPKPTNPFYHEIDISHSEWLYEVWNHKFVLAPFGHGLDTHRISEILFMGGIPVMRKSSISSCYDDSDNDFNGQLRGSLPVVILDSWADLTKERLDLEWERISKIPNEKWDYKRLFLNHWIERIGKPILV